MPITTVKARTKLPILGTIRLGKREKANSGHLFPTNVDHFILDDAPGVEAVYGANPQSIEVMFLTDDQEQAAPTNLMWFSAGRTDSTGKAIGGDLNCKGPGPDENGNPGKAEYFLAKDHKTRVVPERDCFGDKCPDWRDAKGRPKCKQMMQVIVMLPRVSVYGVYIITTSSWRSIHAFNNQLSYIKDLNKGVLKGIPWRIFRKEEAVAHTDQNGSRSVRNHWIMKIELMTNFRELYGQEFANKIESVKTLNLAPATVSTKALLASGGHEDFYPNTDNPEDFKRLQIERGEAPAIDVDAKKLTADDINKDPEVDKLFNEWAGFLGQDFPEKTRLIMIRKKEAEGDQRAAVIQTLNEKIAEERAKQAKALGDNVIHEEPVESDVPEPPPIVKAKPKKPKAPQPEQTIDVDAEDLI